jgi:glycosyltransferase involved in cell wall biosynthesis
MTASPVRVAFDVTPVISGRTGIARYVTQLTAALEALSVELRRFAVGRSAFPLPSNTTHIRVPARLVERWWRAIPWPVLEQLAGSADLVHASGLLVPRTRRPLVVTVHDVAALRYPELHPARHVFKQQVLLAALDRASVIVTVSHATADDLAHLGIEDERLVVAPLGVTLLPKPELPAPDENIGRGYLLAVGETSPRKRYSVLLRALARLGGDVRLVIAGPPARDEIRLQSLVAALGVSPRVTRLGLVSDAALAGLYSGALALCFPSVAEGFGLPVLEAMAAGLPVLASDIPATRELAGNAALYVSGDEEQAWADAIESVISDAPLRARLAEAGRQRAAEFTWQRTATATLSAYRLALEVAP